MIIMLVQSFEVRNSCTQKSLLPRGRVLKRHVSPAAFQERKSGYLEIGDERRQSGEVWRESHQVEVVLHAILITLTV
jgi:hypothetical protein